jgi:hypothetical protein
MATKIYYDADRYDEADDSILAYPAALHRDEILGSEVAERRLYRARPEKGSSYFYCREHGEVGKKGEGCGRLCDSYEPRNGKNGRCRFSAPCYEAVTNEVLVVKNPDIRPGVAEAHRDQY